ncbi:MAG: transposase [Phycisphaerae bacterium]|nr:transposase [Phycisphaerae bacterium]
MPRNARIVIPYIAHHITQRGNNKQDVFFVDDDMEKFLYLLSEQAKRFGVIIEGFCLMTNHIHIIATPTRQESLAKALGRVNLLYSQYISYMHGRTGHLWQNRFYSCPLDTNHFFTALSYIEQNPVRAKMVRYPWTYRWSSAGFHIGQEDEFCLMDKKRWRQQSSSIDWKNILRRKLEKLDIDKLRIHCRTGRPLGTDKFISKLETVIGRRLRALPVGRPKKKAKRNIKR